MEFPDRSEVDGLIDPQPLPEFARVRYEPRAERLDGVAETARKELGELALDGLDSGATVAVGVGSRGIDRIDEVAAAVVDRIAERGFGPVVVPWDDPESPTMGVTASVYDRILALADEYPDGSLYLMGFSPLEDGSLDRVMEQTGAAVQRLRTLLEERGISADRIRTRVLGPLVPTVEAERSGRRIEVMLVREGNDE